MQFESVSLKQAIVVNKVYTIHYFEYNSAFCFPGESHNFWEFLCVDKGEVDVNAGTQSYSLKKDEVIFHKPNEFHNVTSHGKAAPNLVVISFECNSPAMAFFNDRILTIGEPERNLLAQIITECQRTFLPPFNDPYFNRLVRAEHPCFGSEQMIKLYLEQFLLQLIRKYTVFHTQAQAPRVLKQKNDNDLYNRIMGYLETHLHSQLTIDQICKDNLIGRSQLQKLFRDKNGCGIIDYFTRMKVNAAKQLIRNQELNFTQIADTLGYTSIHYFSRQFKKITGMTPSEYSSSIKSLAERRENF